MTSQIVPKVPEKSAGNTKQISPAIRWCFTLHNPKSEEITELCNISSESSKFCIFSEEFGKSKDTYHIQGYIEFKEKKRPLGIHSNKTIHWEKAKGNREQNVRYIKKENGTYWLNGEKVDALRIITTLYPWQMDLLEITRGDPDDRKIYWYKDELGGKGKSAFTKLLCAKSRAIVLSGKATDCKYGIIKYIEKNGMAPKIVIIDVPRCTGDHISFTAIEEIKNGCFFSSKYESEMVLFNPPHLIVFSNSACPEGKFSDDRLINVDLS